MLADELCVGVAVPKAAGELEPTDRLRERLLMIEEAGADSVWVTDSGLGYPGSLSPTPLLAFAAAITSRLRLGAAVYVLPLHAPVRLAQDLATIDRLSGGRLTIGLGLGGKDDEYPPYGVDRSGRVGRYEAAIQTLQAVWRGGAVTVSGPGWSLSESRVEPKPIQHQGPPIWFGGRSDAAMRRAAAWGSGWVSAGSMSTAAHSRLLPKLAEHLRRAGRKPEGFEIAKRVYIAVEDEPGSAGEPMREAMDTIYHRADLANEVALVGSYTHCRAALRSLQLGGTDTLILHPLFDLDRQLDHIAALIGELQRA